MKKAITAETASTSRPGTEVRTRRRTPIWLNRVGPIKRSANTPLAASTKNARAKPIRPNQTW